MHILNGRALSHWNAINATSAVFSKLKIQWLKDQILQILSSMKSFCSWKLSYWSFESFADAHCKPALHFESPVGQGAVAPWMTSASYWWQQKWHPRNQSFTLLGSGWFIHHMESQILTKKKKFPAASKLLLLHLTIVQVSFSFPNFHLLCFICVSYVLWSMRMLGEKDI